MFENLKMARFFFKSFMAKILSSSILIVTKGVNVKLNLKGKRTKEELLALLEDNRVYGGDVLGELLHHASQVLPKEDVTEISRHFYQVFNFPAYKFKKDISGKSAKKED